MAVDLKFLIGKLNPTCRAALESAARLTVSRTHYEVEVEHLLRALMDVPRCDVSRIFSHFEIDRSRLTIDLEKALDGQKTGNPASPSLADRLVRVITEAWNIASLEMGASEVRSAMLLAATLKKCNLSELVRDVSGEFLKLNLTRLRDQWDTLLDNAEGLSATGGKTNTETPNLDRYTIDLTAAARTNAIDPVFGRTSEIRQVIDILTRRRQHNPILTGEAGVGKTAIVEGLALRIAKGDVPPALRDVSVRSLDLGLLQAGAGIRGEFENRLKSVISEVKGSSQPVILFIDEAHTLIGAGGASGQGDAANLLKPALARGELRTIAATTQAEYKRYFEKDAALARRFQVVKVDEPDEDQAIAMLRGLSGTLEKHHGVRVLGEAIDAAVRLSHRYITGRQLPDKAVSVLDTACARVRLSQTATPAKIEDLQQRISQLEAEIALADRETSEGFSGTSTIDAKRNEVATAKSDLQALSERYRQEKEFSEKIIMLRSSGNGKLDLAELNQLDGSLKQLQGIDPLVHTCVNSQNVAEIIASWTGIPVGRMVRDEAEVLRNLEQHIGKRVIGQDEALATISRRIRTARAGIEDPGRPKGVFLLTGPSGVGKTETAHALAEILYGGERNVIVINMSEFQEAHTVSLLKGSPPGYVGYGEGGVLTEAVRLRPYSVILLDEVEKAHQDVIELFYQVFDKGRMEDAEGREIDFRNALILMTSNVIDVENFFKPAFLGRTVVVPYREISTSAMRQIAALKMKRIQARLRETRHIELNWSDGVIDELARRSDGLTSGARHIDHILTDTLLPEISLRLLARDAGVRVAEVDVVAGEFEYVFR